MSVLGKVLRRTSSEHSAGVASNAAANTSATARATDPAQSDPNPFIVREQLATFTEARRATGLLGR